MPEIVLEDASGSPYKPSWKVCTGMLFFDTDISSSKAWILATKKLQYAFRSRNVQFLYIHSDFEKLGARESEEFKKETGLDILHFDHERKALGMLHGTTPPAFYVVDANGMVRKSIGAEGPPDYEQMKKYVEYALGFLDKKDLESIPLATPAIPEGKLTADTEEKTYAASPDTPKQPDPGTPGTPDTPKQPDPGTPGTPKQPDPGTPGTPDMPKQPNEAKLPETSGKTPEKPSLWKELAGKNASDAFFLPTIIIPTPIGQEPPVWKQENTLGDAIFSLWLDFWIKLIPLMIWGWGILICLCKMRQYRGMLYGLFGCAGLFLCHAWYLCFQLPIDAGILVPDIWRFQKMLLDIRADLFFHELFPDVASLSYWRMETLLAIVFQCALIAAIAGKHKKDQPHIAQDTSKG